MTTVDHSEDFKGGISAPPGDAMPALVYRFERKVLNGNSFEDLLVLACEGQYILALGQCDLDRFSLIPLADSKRQFDVDRSGSTVGIDQEMLLPAGCYHPCGEGVFSGLGCIEGVFEKLALAGAAVMQLHSTQVALHEFDLPRAVGRFAAGSCRNRDRPVADDDLAVGFGDSY